MGTTICFVGDNRDRTNLGCRATSIALNGLLEAVGAVTSTVSGDDITGPMTIDRGNGRLRPPDRLRRILWNRHQRISVAVPTPIGEWADLLLLGPREAARRINEAPNRFPAGRALLEAIEGVDLVVINGEGDLILSPYRRKMAFLATLMHLCALRRVPYAYVNSMVSKSADGGASDRVIADAGEVLADASLFSVRDGMSAELSAELGLPIPHVVPDALFAWRPPPLVDAGLVSALAASWPNEGQRVELEDRRYVCLGGSSWYSKQHPPPIDSYIHMVEAVRREGLVPVVVECDPVDRFLLDVSAATGAFYVPWNAHIIVHAEILGRAGAFISGRYHPTILAARGGTPSVPFGSNSHKMSSLMDLLDQHVTGRSADVTRKDADEMVTEACSIAGDDRVIEANQATVARLRGEAETLVDLLVAAV
jgi:hypothetical protein